ncbi:aminoglycoside phosphotransferase family protein [Paenibacillus sp. MWE-103]|uniref:Aminoglycoside phosphotransferase family protein n=1 Tax=Paenibacillus artemisiicola TaxID=1172618 RepID=A0ABS3WDR6_9BACL|nr:aminoglycoside phosphotransferase family protein [Paenibacillus artemisiicola]MBO7746447.1 aminoglycoside phosphotransferase family protein [Paenibacillus artemisiicola]
MTDPQTAERFVQARFGERARSLAPLATGGWSSAYALVLDGRDTVIRFGAYRADFEKDRAMGAYATAALPIPRVLELGETDSGYYAVSERVRGTKHLEELDGPELEQALPPLLDGLRGLQEADLAGTQAAGLWRPEGEGPSWGEELLAVTGPRDRLAGWREKLAASPREAAVFDAGAAKLRELAPRLPECRGLVHNDLLNRNVLVDGGRVTGVFDWGNAFYGDPLYDQALFLYWQPWFPHWRGLDLPALLDRHRAKHGGPPPRMEERLLACLLHIGLDHIAYSAFRGRAEDMRGNAEQVSGYL